MKNMHNTTPLVMVVVLNYCNSYDTILCLESLVKITWNNFRIVVVDNCSPDDSVNTIEQYLCGNNREYIRIKREKLDTLLGKLPNIILIENEVNGGFGAGNNVGISFSISNGADYVLTLNNDTEVESGFLEPLVRVCENNPEIGVVSGQIFFWEDKEVFWFNGGLFNKFTGKLIHQNFNEKDIGQQPLKYNSFLSGCMWFMPKAVVEKVGLLNEDYFMYVEDLEYCQRVLAAGYSLQVSDESKIYHKVSASTVLL